MNNNNSRRITKSILKDINEKAFSVDRKRTIDTYQKLKDLQQKEKINDCILVRYIKRCGIKRPQNDFSEEIDMYMKNKKLRTINLKKLHAKISNILKNQKSTTTNKITKSLSEVYNNNVKQQQLTEMSPSHSTLSPKKTKLNPINKNNALRNNLKNPTLSQEIVKSQENLNENEKNINNNISDGINSINTIPQLHKKNFVRKKIFLKPEEELAELEKELGLEQETEMRKKRYERFYKFFSEGNEWEAIYKYNHDIYEKKLEKQKQKKIEDRIILKEELDKQIKEKELKEYQENLENEKFKKFFNERHNKLILMEKEKEEEKIKKLNLEKIAQREQMKNRKIMERITLLKQKKYDKDLINNIKIELEKEKKLQEEKKLKNFLEMKKILKESQIKIEQKKEEKIRQKELDKIFCENLEIAEKKKDNERAKILNKIKSVGDYHQNDKTKKILEKMQHDLEEEDEKMKQFIKARKESEDKKEEEAKKRKIEIRKELRNFLDNQIEEKKKEKEFEKALIREQGKIWNEDSEKYREEQKMIEEKIRMNGIKNGEILRKQIEYNNNRKMKKNSMSSAEYSLNKQEINKIIDSMEDMV